MKTRRNESRGNVFGTATKSSRGLSKTCVFFFVVCLFLVSNSLFAAASASVSFSGLSMKSHISLAGEIAQEAKTYVGAKASVSKLKEDESNRSFIDSMIKDAKDFVGIGHKVMNPGMALVGWFMNSSDTDESSDEIEKADAEGSDTVNGVPVRDSNRIKELLGSVSDELSGAKTYSENEIDDLVEEESDDGNENLLTNAFKEMLENLDLSLLTEVEKDKLIEDLERYHRFKAQIDKAPDSSNLKGEALAFAKMKEANQIFGMVEQLNKIMAGLKKATENKDGTLISEKANNLGSNLQKKQTRFSDKYSEISSRLVLRYALSKAQPLCTNYQRLVESQLENDGHNGYKSSSNKALTKNLIAMKDYVGAVKTMYQNYGTNGETISVRSTGYRSSKINCGERGAKFEGTSHAGVMLAKLGRSFDKVRKSIKKEFYKVNNQKSVQVEKVNNNGQSDNGSIVVASSFSGGAAGYSICHSR